jgi:hypothetical protein
MKLQLKLQKLVSVVAVMSIFCKKKCNLQSANPRNKKPSRQKAESANFPEKNSREPRKLFAENEKRPVTEEISA